MNKYLILAAMLSVAAGTNTVVTTPSPVAQPAPMITVVSNVVKFNGQIIGNVSGTNFVAVPNVQSLSESYSNGFALGVKYGAIATRRVPEVTDNETLLHVAASLMKATQPPRK